MGELMLNSKIKLGCTICDKCCINRGDIKIMPLNVIEISRYLGISKQQFLDMYTSKVEDEPLEIVIKSKGNKHRCIFNNEKDFKCNIHDVEPMQCVTFPLIPIDIKRDIFFNQDTCVCENKKEMRVIDWLNGKKGIYLRCKKIYADWIDFIEYVQTKWSKINEEQKSQIFNIMYLEYREDIKNVQKAIRKNMRKVKRLIKKQK